MMKVSPIVQCSMVVLNTQRSTVSGHGGCTIVAFRYSLYVLISIYHYDLVSIYLYDLVSIYLYDLVSIYLYDLVSIYLYVLVSIDLYALISIYLFSLVSVDCGDRLCFSRSG